MKLWHTIKKLLLLTGILLLPIIPCYSWQEAGMTGIKGSSNIDTLHPPALAIDDQVETYTGFTAEPGEQGWIELTTDEVLLIYGLTINAEIPANTSLTIEYEKNGVYYPFISSFINGPVFGEQTIDLSYDTIAAHTIRLTCTGTSLSQIKLYELDILSDSPGTRVMKIKPDHMRSDFKNSRFFSEQNLVDGLPGTFWMTWKDENIKGINWSLYDAMDDFYIEEDPSDNKENVAFLFNEPGPLDALYLYITELAQGTADVTINLPSNTVILETVDLNTIRGWHRIDIPDALTGIDAIEIEYYGNTDEYGGIGEVEFVRTEPYNGDTYREIVLPATPVEGTEIHCIFPIDTIVSDDTVIIETAVSGNQADSFSVKINGKEKSASTQTYFNLYTVYTYELGPTEARVGDNFFSYVSITGDTSLLYARIRKSQKDGFTPLMGDNLGDKKLVEPGTQTGEVVYEFDETYYIEGLLVHGIENFDAILSWWDGISWQDLVPEETNPHLKTYTGSFTTRMMKVNASAGHISEIQLSIRRTEDKTPTIKILYPEYIYQEEMKSDLVNKDFICIVDNAACDVAINALTPTSQGTLFWISMTDLVGDFDSGLFTFDITAIDAEGRAASASIGMLVNQYDYQFVIDQNTEDVIYTADESITLSGYFQHPQGRLFINGEEAAITECEYLKWCFSEVVSVNAGMNLFELVVEHESTGRILTVAVVKVFRFSQSLFLNITNPTGLTMVNTDTIIVSGYVKGTGDIQVHADGYACSIEGTRFISEEIQLFEGPNSIMVTATDQTGAIAEQTITVILDTLAPVITAVSPADNTWLNTTQIDVSGTVVETNGFYVYINGLPATVQNNDFNKTIECPEGGNSISITAADISGNISLDYVFAVNIDTTPPEPFNATANPAGWTNNPQPVISFSTTDTGSGIDRYEILVDGGPPVIATSPHTLPVLEDGVHAVTVRAIDNLGNIQASTVEVSIDTTPPNDPEVFRLVTGKTDMALSWNKPDEDIVEYLLYRLPEWDTGEYITVTEQEYLDTTVEEYVRYKYQIYSVDRAGNQSPGETSAAGIVGMEVELYNNEAGTFVEYENVSFMAKPGSLPETVKAIIIKELESEELRDISDYPIVSPIYSFNVIQEVEGELKELNHVQFDNEFVCWIDYKEEDLPQYFPEQNLGVFYFDTLWSKWFMVEKSMVDRENKRVYFATNHFTEFSVQPVMIEDLSPQELQDTGYSPFKADVVHEGVTVSPQGGTAMTSVTELVLPGKGGFNFEIKRNYDSATARTDCPSLAVNASLDLNFHNMVSEIASLIVQMGTTAWMSQIEAKLESYLKNAGDYSYSMGAGWRLNFPYIRTMNGGVLLRLPDGSFHNINKMELTDCFDTQYIRILTFENHEGADFKLTVRQIRSDINFTSLISLGINELLDMTNYEDPSAILGLIESLIPGWNMLNATLTMADGTVYRFDGGGKVTSMEDPTRLNKISFSYNLLDNKIEKIIDSMNREITFNYDTDGPLGLMPRITEIKLNDVDGSIKTISYGGEFDDSESFFFPLARLDSATDFEGRTWNYEYDEHKLISGLAGAKVSPVLLVLEFIPGVGQAANAFASEVLGISAITLYGRYQREKVSVLSHLDGPGIGIIDITYENRGLERFYIEGADYFLGILPTAVQFNYEWQRRLLVIKVEESNGNLVKTTDYSYTIDHIKGNQYYTSESTANDHKLKRVYSFDKVKKTRSRYADVFDWAIDQLLNLGFTESAFIDEYIPYNTEVKYYNVAGGFNEHWQSEYTLTDTDSMRVTSKSIDRIGGTNFTTTNLEYDKWGNVVYSEEITGLEDRVTSVESYMCYAYSSKPASTEITWPPGAYPHPELGERIVYDDQGNQTGTKPINIHNLLLGSAVKISVPNLNGDDGHRMQYSYNLYNEYGQLTEIKQWIGEGTYSAGNPGEWATTSCEYDEWGNVNKITNPETHETSIVYDYDYNDYWYTVTKTEHDVRDIDNQAIVITTIVAYEKATGKKAWEQNPRQFTTEYAYDKIGRIIAIKKPDPEAAPGYKPTEPLDKDDTENSLRIVYDDELYTSTVTNSRGAVVVYDYNSMGQLKEIIKYNRPRDAEGTITGVDTEGIHTYIGYDAYGNIDSIINPLTFETTYEYDAMGRMTKITYPEEDGITPEKNISFDYDAGELTIIDENGNQTMETYDLKGRLLKKTYYGEYNMYLFDEQIYYDGAGNKVITIDGEGNRTFTEYDSRNLPERTILPEDTFHNILTGTDVTLTPYIRFEYDKIGVKTGEMILDFNNTEITTSFENDEIGRVLRITRPYTDYTTDPVSGDSVIEKFRYDANGNKTEYIDGRENTWYYTYDGCDQLTAEENPRGNTTAYAYDSEGNKEQMTDPRGNVTSTSNATFTIDYFYDDLNRITGGKLPKGHTEEERKIIQLIYDVRGNLDERIDADGGTTRYDYTKRNWVETETRIHVNEDLTETTITTTYDYDLAGNLEKTIDGEGRTTEIVYDTLNRVKEEYVAGVLKARYTYDKMGNIKTQRDGKENLTIFTYNAYKKMISITDALLKTSEYKYDIRGNQVKLIDPRDVTTKYMYDELNRLVREINVVGDETLFGYDKAGNIIYKEDPKGTVLQSTYNTNNTLASINIDNLTISAESLSISYTYDEAGDIKTIQNDDVLTRYNYANNTYIPDPFSRIYNVETTINGQTYTVGYDYDIMGRTIELTYPQNHSVSYNYNTIGQLLTVPGFIETPISYYNNGLMDTITAANNISHELDYDNQNRLFTLDYTKDEDTFKAYQFDYDEINNIICKTINGNQNFYAYDELNRLISSTNKGSFEIDVKKKEYAQKIGKAEQDYGGEKVIEFTVEETECSLDYNSMSIGVDIERTDVRLSRIELTPDSLTYDIEKDNLALYVSMENLPDTNETDHWQQVPAEEWALFVKEDKSLEILLLTPIPARFVKVHCHIDDRDETGNPIDLSTFKNTKEAIIAVYYMVNTMYESYIYDDSSNRESYRKIIPNEIDELTSYTYYENTNRLKTDDEYGYVWDENGNLTEKGKKYTLGENTLIFESDEGEYWYYEYDLLNRLVSVSKSDNGKALAVVIAEYTYDHNGYRVKKMRHVENETETIYYIFGLGGVVLYKEQVEKDTYEEFVFVAGKHFAKYEGRLSDTTVVKYFYHTDHLGSVTVVTDESGNVVWAEEFLAFGVGTGATGLIESPKIYTGKELDEDSGLYYFNARWYAAELGRFITEDPTKDGINWYVYCSNNPLVFIDFHGFADYNFDENTVVGYHATVEKNDTLSKISKEWYGSTDYIDLIAKYNNIKNKDLIFVGQEIALPAIAELVGEDEYFVNRINYLKNESTMLNNQTKVLAENLNIDTESITYTLIPPPTEGKGVNPIVVIDLGTKGMKAGLHHMGIDVNFGVEIGNDAISVKGHHSIITDEETVRLTIKGTNEGFSPGGAKFTDEGVKYEQPKFSVSSPTIPISLSTSGKVGIDIKLKDNWFDALVNKETQIPVDLIIKGKFNVGIYQFVNLYGQLKLNICQTARVYLELYEHFNTGKELEPIKVK